MGRAIAPPPLSICTLSHPRCAIFFPRSPIAGLSFALYRRRATPTWPLSQRSSGSLLMKETVLRRLGPRADSTTSPSLRCGLCLGGPHTFRENVSFFSATENTACATEDAGSIKSAIGGHHTVGRLPTTAASSHQPTHCRPGEADDHH